jgi:hypothetical protein
MNQTEDDSDTDDRPSDASDISTGSSENSTGSNVITHGNEPLETLENFTNKSMGYTEISSASYEPVETIDNGMENTISSGSYEPVEPIEQLTTNQQFTLEAQVAHLDTSGKREPLEIIGVTTAPALGLAIPTRCPDCKRPLRQRIRETNWKIYCGVCSKTFGEPTPPLSGAKA